MILRTILVAAAPLAVGAALLVSGVVSDPDASADPTPDPTPTTPPDSPDATDLSSAAPGAVARPVVVRATTQASAAVQPLRTHLALGDSGEDVALLQERLHELGYDPGPVDGHFRMPLVNAVLAFQKVHGRTPDGEVTLPTWRDLSNPTEPAALVPDGMPTRVEVDLHRQLLHLYEDGERTLTTHVSTGSGQRFCTDRGGCRRAITPAGDFAFTWRVAGWRESDLGLLYNPLYFHGGIAIHGSTRVPTEPSSFGCVRVPMHIAEYLPGRVSRGDPVHVRS